MNTISMTVIADQLNEMAHDFAIGQLQDIRVKLHNLKNRPGTKIFRKETIFPDYAFHYGGRKELQFNIGFDKLDKDNDIEAFRYGVAFSLETNISMHDISPFNPMIERFNHYLRTNLSAFSDYLMWYWSSTEGRSYNYIPRPIEKELIAINNFIFFGKLRCLDRVDPKEILTEFDYLLPLYEYIVK